jgi:hypothetical protein
MTKRATTPDAAVTPRDEAEAVLRDLERRRERLVERGAALAAEPPRGRVQSARTARR